MGRKEKEMDADIKGALEQINKSYRAFEHNGQSMSKHQVMKVLEYGLSKGYKAVSQISDDEVDRILTPQSSSNCDHDFKISNDNEVKYCTKCPYREWNT